MVTSFRLVCMFVQQWIAEIAKDWPGPMLSALISSIAEVASTKMVYLPPATLAG